jgi:hypothetical protein
MIMSKTPATLTALCLFILTLLVSCGPSGPTELEMAETYAAQTLTARPSETLTATLSEPTATMTPEAPTPTPTLTATPAPVGPVDFPEGVNPLTGLVVGDPTLLDRRPVFVKVANYPASGRPHAGLSLADLVFEYYIGYGTNRFMAVYYSQDAEKIGPVRSGRLVDPQLVSMYEGILGFQGAYETILSQIVGALGDRAISGTGDVCPAICDDGRNIVTSVFANSAELTALAETRGVVNQRFPLEGMFFSPQAPKGGAAGDQATILFANQNRGEWRFDVESGLYLRWIEDVQEGQDLEMIPLVDSQTEEQLAFANVIVVFAYYTEYTPAMHDIDIWGNTAGRRAIIFRDGQAYEATWKAVGQTQPIQFLDQSGAAFPLKPGNSWIVIMGINSGVVEDAGLWTFNFYLP